jgi:hypothetical protein
MGPYWKKQIYGDWIVRVDIESANAGQSMASLPPVFNHYPISAVEKLKRQR